MMEENRKNPEGYGHSALITASLFVSDAEWMRIAAGAIIKIRF